jgi:hypothetical protein
MAMKLKTGREKNLQDFVLHIAASQTNANDQSMIAATKDIIEKYCGDQLQDFDIEVVIAQSMIGQLTKKSET